MPTPKSVSAAERIRKKTKKPILNNHSRDKIKISDITINNEEISSIVFKLIENKDIIGDIIEKLVDLNEIYIINALYEEVNKVVDVINRKSEIDALRLKS